MEIEKRLLAFKTVCNRCNEQFDTYDLSDFAYGERILLSEDGTEYAYINCIEDNVFEEVLEVVKSFHGNNDYIYCFNKVFGSACDKINGKSIDASRSKRVCINCKSSDLDIWEYEPPKVTDKNVFLVTHLVWDLLGKEEKILMIKRKMV